MQGSSHQLNTHNGTASATRHHCARHGDDNDGTNAPTNLLPAPPPVGTMQKHLSDGARRMEAAIKHHAASGQPAARPTPHNNDEQIMHTSSGWDGGRTNEQTYAQKNDVHGCSDKRIYAAESQITVSERHE